ncbi:G-protein coupled receptor GRL101 [Patella vulgata]|uniref:G-protein coupled receptor GRL101 n=1 Tax=Patella vulgata TaxID=6465 RepID=UPI00217F9503|nr:G-protein coupled receptor GRL101 [Patella vulgata]
MAFYCDFKFHCRDMSDEKHCVRRPCYEDIEWKCSSGECIPFQQRCNLKSDCKDGSDERNCDVCKDSTFQCYDGRCISKTRVCDGYVDCMGLYGEDEGPTCTRKSQTSCGSWNALGVTENGKYQLYINNETFEVECTFNDDKVNTVFHHDMEDLNYVGYTDLDQNIQYSASLATIAVFKDTVLQCRQYLDIGCHQLVWAYDSENYWHDINGQTQLFSSDSKDKDACSCILKDSCTQNITKCNCDSELSAWFSMDDNAWMKDHGYIDDKGLLPVTLIRMESVRVLQGLKIYIGPLECEEDTHMKNNFLLCDSGIVVPATTRCILDYDVFGVETGCRDLSHLNGCANFGCPLDHVKCPESYCLPVRNVCNDKADCPNKEDEQNCDDWSCEGYFKCRETKICLPWKEVCDGIKHCPEGDDELLCDNTCPPRCTCDGLIVKCTEFYNDTLSVLNTNTTYLDLKNAHFFQDPNFQSLENLGYLDLSFTNIKYISKEMFKNLYNLIHLNLGYNSITKLGKHTFYDLKNLRFLNLLGNKGLAAIEPLAFEGLSNLKHLDLSGMSLETIVFETFSGLSAVATLNLSGNGIYSIKDKAFDSLGGLSMLDLQRNDIGQFSGLIFDGLSNLSYLHTDRYTFCCLKPTSVLAENCLPEPDEFSSCSDLMKNETLRISMWFLGLIALIGNLFVLLYRAIFDSTGFKKSNGIIVANLSLADFFMGIYMLIIASADVLYRGTYSWNDVWWRNSYVCKLAGFIATFSSEASVMFLCLITIDRVIAIKFPFSKLKITKKSAALYVSAIWILSLCFAFFPLIATSYFKDQFFSRTGVCLGLPLTRDRSPGWEYGVGIFIVWNFICFVVIALGQGLIYHEIRQSSQRLQFQRKSDMTVARKLSFIVMSDFICWFPICVLGLMALRGYVIPGEVYAWTAVFILPINSALNPIIYTASSIQMKQVVRKLTNRANTRSKSMRDSTETTEIQKGVHDIRSSELFKIDPPQDAVRLTDYLHSNTDLSMFLEITIRIATSMNTLHKNGFVLAELSESQLFVYAHEGKVQRLCSSILPIQSCDYDELQHDIKLFGILVSKILKAYTVGKKKLEYGI